MKFVSSRCNDSVRAAMLAESIGKLMFLVLGIVLTLSMALAAITSVCFRDIVSQGALDGGAAWAGATASLGELARSSSEPDAWPASSGSVRTVSAPVHSVGK